MSQKLPENADIRQLRIQAKELVRNSREMAEAEPLKLSAAQYQVARQYGYQSWPKLVEAVEHPALKAQFTQAVRSGDLSALEKLLKSKPIMRTWLNEPLFDFDCPAVVFAAGRPNTNKMLSLLVEFGADANSRSSWWAGGFSALDLASEDTADHLIKLGARFDVWSAATHGRLDHLRELITQYSDLVNARGGDGQTPLHFAANAQIAKFLIESGADLELRDIDHESTPIQHHILNPEILRQLISAGAKPDIFTAVMLDDADLIRDLKTSQPGCENSHTGAAPFTTKKSQGGHIYIYKLGSHKTPLMVAAEWGKKIAADELLADASPGLRLVTAAWAEDEARVAAIMLEHRVATADLAPYAQMIPHAAQAGKVETIRLLLQAGMDPSSKGLDSGNALQVACWFGHIGVVKLLSGLFPLDAVDGKHGSPPLGWAAHGAQWCGNPEGDYVAVVEHLLQSGADVHAPANSNGVSMISQAGNRADVVQVLRRYGAS